MAYRATLRICERTGLDVRDAAVAVVGARGSVGALLARLFARARPRRLLLVGNPASGTAPLERLRASLGEPGLVEVHADLAALAGCEVVVAATGAARPVLDEAPLAPGTIVCDVARPRDAGERVRARPDLVVLDGGLVRLPDPAARFGAGNLQGLPDGVQLACLSETMLLALAGDLRDRGVGDDVPLAQVDEALALAELHGFALAEPEASPGESDLAALREAAHLWRSAS
jgi:predicted amino acid dehydrogenase